MFMVDGSGNVTAEEKRIKKGLKLLELKEAQENLEHLRDKAEGIADIQSKVTGWLIQNSSRRYVSSSELSVLDFHVREDRKYRDACINIADRMAEARKRVEEAKEAILRLDGNNF